MLFLVDGYNAVRRVERLRQVEARDGLAFGRDALVTAILSSGILRVHQVTVMFDGGAEVPAGEPSPHRSLTVRYSRPPQTADDAIVRFLERKRKNQPTTVVTADEELAFSARRLGAAVIAPEAWEGVREPKRAKRRRVTEATDKPTVTTADVAYWLEIFKDEGS